MRIPENSTGYRVSKILIRIAIVAFCVFLVYEAFGAMLPGLIPIVRHGTEQELADYLSEMGGLKGAVSVFLLAVMQVVSVVIPGMIVQFAAGVIYGWWKAFILCYAGFVLANVAVFCFARRFGRNVVDTYHANSRVRWVMDQLQKADPHLAVAIACMIPGIPNGILPHIAAHSRITVRGFAMSVMCSCWIQILFMCIAGNYVIRGEYGIVVVAFLIQIALILLVIWKRNWFMRER